MGGGGICGLWHLAVVGWMTVEQFVPDAWITLLYVLFSYAHFESNKLVRARAAGRRGESEAAGAFIDASGAIGLAAIGFVCVLFLGLAIRGSIFLRLGGTLAIWPLGAVLVYVAFFN